jgi:predicted nucleotide-binding protein
VSWHRSLNALELLQACTHPITCLAAPQLIMAKRPPPQPHPANLRPEQIKPALARIEKRITDLEALNPAELQQRGSPEVVALRVAIDETRADTFGPDSVEYQRYREAARLYEGAVPLYIGGPGRPAPHVDFRGPLEQSKQRSIALLKQAVAGLKECFSEFADQAESVPQGSERSGTSELPWTVFIVHGHDEAIRETVARFLEKIGFRAIILHEQPNKGRALINKFSEVAGGTGFAVVLMTPDDIGGPAGGQQQPRARQNVIFELGYFIGLLGPTKVAAIVDSTVELPSDYDGVVYIPWEGDWRRQLAMELEGAGYDIDWNAVMKR